MAVKTSSSKVNPLAIYVISRYFSSCMLFTKIADTLCTGFFEIILRGFDIDPDDFMVLAPDEPINGCTFLQATVNTTKSADSSYTIETGFGRKKRSSALYRLSTKDKDVVLQYFTDYWRNQITPDISSWEDVSGEMK